MRIFRSASAILTCALLGACQDLTVVDKNRPSLDVSLATAANLETTVGSATRYWMAIGPLGESVNNPGSTTFLPVLEGYNEAITYNAFSPSSPYTAALREPPRAEFDHNADNFNVNKAPFQDAYAAISVCHDVRAAIANGVKDAAFPQWERANYYCKLVMGFAHLYVGAMFDKGYVVKDDFIRPIDYTQYINNWVPHDSIVEYSKTLIHEGIAEAKKAPVTSTLTTWINGVAYTNVDMAKIAYGYLARAEIWKAATPEQREDKSNGGVVDWRKVIAYVDSSITSKWTVAGGNTDFPTFNVGGMTPGPNFVSKGSSASAFRSADLALLMSTSTTVRMHHKILGPADTTGAYAWYRRTPVFERSDTVYSSPDKRLPRGPCLVVNGVTPSYNQGLCLPRHVNTTNANYVGNALAGDGNYFQLLDRLYQLTFNGELKDPWNRASYQFIRFGTTPNNRRLGGTTTQGVLFVDFVPHITPEEQNLMRAEAHMRLGNPAAALPLINLTRTATNKGALPAITQITGPSEPFPRCVPHAFFDAEKCGDLWDALLWEKRMEQLGTDAFMNWVDWRAWGLLDKGTLVYFPPSYRETGQLGFPYYTYGGNLPGSVGSTQQCGSGTWQSIGCTNYPYRPRLPMPPE